MRFRSSKCQAVMPLRNSEWDARLPTLGVLTQNSRSLQKAVRAGRVANPSKKQFDAPVGANGLGDNAPIPSFTFFCAIRFHDVISKSAR
jgi:hypothetical protein